MKNNIPADAVIHIEGHSELIRDHKTGAVINTATTEYKRFVEKREKEKMQQKHINELESRLEKLETLMLEMLNKQS